MPQPMPSSRVSNCQPARSDRQSISQEPSQCRKSIPRSARAHPRTLRSPGPGSAARARRAASARGPAARGRGLDPRPSALLRARSRHRLPLGWSRLRACAPSPEASVRAATPSGSARCAAEPTTTRHVRHVAFVATSGAYSSPQYAHAHASNVRKGPHLLRRSHPPPNRDRPPTWLCSEPRTTTPTSRPGGAQRWGQPPAWSWRCRSSRQPEPP